MNFHAGQPKQCSAWTSGDLLSHNVKIIDTDVATFFGLSNLPHPTAVSQAVLTTPLSLSSENPSEPFSSLGMDDRLFLTHLYLAMQPRNPPFPNEDACSSLVINFVFHLLNLLGFSGKGEDRVIQRHRDMPLFMCGRNVHAVAELCVMHPSPKESVVLLVKEDRRQIGQRGVMIGGGDPEAQLFAQAIAAFQMHNRALRLARLPQVEKKVIPAIVKNGTVPVFYKFEITAALVECVQTSRFPRKVTKVHKLVPPVPRPANLKEEGMGPVDNRGIMLSCLEAFKEFVWLESSFSLGI